MKRKIFAVLLMLALSMTCIACDMGEAVETGNSNVVVSMEGEAEEMVEAASTPNPSPLATVALTSTPSPTVAPTSTPTPTVAPTSTPTPTMVPANKPTPSPIPSPAELPTIAPIPTKRPGADVMVWLPATGEKYHNKNNCGRMNPDKARQVTKSEAERMGYEPCGKCY